MSKEQGLIPMAQKHKNKKQDLTPNVKNLTSVKFYTIEKNRPNK